MNTTNNTAAAFDLDILFAAHDLAEAIAQTNNGYLFNPSAQQLATARANADEFTLRPNGFGTYSIYASK